MDRSELAKQLERYSNAIVAFVVFQGLAFSYTFGKDERFNALLKAEDELSVTLAALFLATLILAVAANRFLRLKLEERSGDYREIIAAVFKGKSVVLMIFGLLPLFVTLRFAVIER